MVLAVLWGRTFGTNLDRENSKNIPMQRGARFVLCRTVPMQRGACFLILGVPLGGPTWPSEGVRNIYKTNAFLHLLKTKRKRTARQKRRR